MVMRRGSLGGKKLRCRGVRPHLNPLPAGEEVASLPPFWIPVRYRGTASRHGGFCRAPHRPQSGDKPPRYISPLAHPSGFRPSPVGVVAWYSESARRILPRPTPAPAGDEPLALAKSSTALHSPHPHPLWIPAPYRGTGQALRWNDEMSGESLSRIGVREVLPCQSETVPGLESILS